MLIAQAEFPPQFSRTRENSEPVIECRHAKQNTTDTSGVVKPKKLLGFGGGHGPYQLHESSHNAEDESDKVQPRSVQPAVKTRTDQPSRESRSRKNKS
jgi:hypothetical protein